MTHSAGDVDPFESLIAELTPETPAIAPVVETEVFDALESSKVLRSTSTGAGQTVTYML